MLIVWKPLEEPERRFLLEKGFLSGHYWFAPVAFRVTVAAFNQRALRVCAQVGYRPVQQFEHPHTGRPFIVLLRDNN